MTKTTTIYGLCDPRMGELRYVGKTVGTLRKRLGRHIGDAQRGGSLHVQRWLRQLFVCGMAPEAFAIETVDPLGGWVEAEQHNIAYFRAVGCSLTNETEGGEGSLGRVVGVASRAKISKALMGHPVLRATRTRISVAKTGISTGPRSAGTREKMSLGAKARPPISERTRARMRAAKLGRHQTDEHRANISAAHKGRTKTPEHLANIQAAKAAKAAISSS